MANRRKRGTQFIVFWGVPGFLGVNHFFRVLILLAIAGPLARAQLTKTDPLLVNPKFGKIVASCKSTSENKLPHVYLIKQWHLSPEINTHDAKVANAYPQEKNQTAIYEQLKTWIDASKLKTIVAEGCEGSIDQKSTLQFNHWNMKDLLAAKDKKNFSEILTSVPFKVEAKYGDAVHAVCGESAQLIKENLLSFSDARADLGYLSRLIEYKNDPIKTKVYLDGVIEAFKLPANASAAMALKALSDDFKIAVGKIKIGIDRRSEHVVEVVSGIPDSPIAIVFGGMHAKKIMEKLEAKGFACDVIEPVGYQNDDELVLSQLEGAVSGLNAVVAAPLPVSSPTSK